MSDIDPIPEVTLAKIAGQGHTVTASRFAWDVWHILAGHVTDDIAKTACGRRAVPIEVEPHIDARAVRHRGANVCANCRTNHNPGDTMTKTMNDTLQKEAGKAARESEAAPDAGDNGKGDTATATKAMSAIKAAEMVLRLEDKPLHVKEITDRILAMTETRLGGKTPSATVGAILAVDIKKPDSVFKRTKPGTYAIKRGR